MSCRDSLPVSSADPLVPTLAVIEQVIAETDSGLIRTFVIGEESPFPYRPGQCAMLSAIGAGESMIAMASTPSRGGGLEFTVKAVGGNTHALHQLGPGDQVGLRGPYGNGFPLERLAGRDIAFVGGGIGMSGLRSLVNYCLDDRERYGRLTVYSGARSPGELCYRTELTEVWPAAPRTEVMVTVDQGQPGWSGNVGLLPDYVAANLEPSPDQVAVVCGPPVMIRYATEALLRLGLRPEDIILTLELKMQCGIGRCGRCNIGDKYVCRDGPVFTVAELGRLPEEL